MKELTFNNRHNEVVKMTEEDVVKLLVEWAISGEALSPEDEACIRNAKNDFESSFKLRELVFAAMDRVKLGSKAWKRLFDIA